MTYESIAKFAQQGGTVYFFLIFAVGCAYAFWPRKAAEFRDAARIPLEDEQ